MQQIPNVSIHTFVENQTKHNNTNDNNRDREWVSVCKKEEDIEEKKNVLIKCIYSLYWSQKIENMIQLSTECQMKIIIWWYSNNNQQQQQQRWRRSLHHTNAEQANGNDNSSKQIKFYAFMWRHTHTHSNTDRRQ